MAAQMRATRAPAPKPAMRPSVNMSAPEEGSHGGILSDHEPLTSQDQAANNGTVIAASFATTRGSTDGVNASLKARNLSTQTSDVCCAHGQTPAGLEGAGEPLTA